MPNIFENTNTNDLTKSKFTNESNNISLSLNQGKKFKKYQNKIVNNLENKINNVNSKEGFQLLPGLELSENGLTENSSKLIEENDYSKNENYIDTLREKYHKTLIKYQIELAKINGSTNSYLNRTSSNNPYLGKNLRFADGKIVYVTQQGVAKPYTSEDIYKNTIGNNGCPIGYTQLDIPWSANYIKGSIILTKPPLVVGSEMIKGQSCGNEGVNVFVNSMIDNPKTKYEGCYADNIDSPLMNFIGGQQGSYTYEQCQNAAIDGGYQYFALQDVNYETSQGYCSVSNNYETAESLGEGMIVSESIALWSSNTNEVGSSAILSQNGSLNVVNTSGSAIFNTDNSTASPGNYLGCYLDSSKRALPLLNKNNTLSSNLGGNKWDNNYDSAFDYANTNGYKYFSIQAANTSGNGQGGFSNSLSSSMKYGKASNCSVVDGKYVGGGWSNALYSTDQTSNYFLILQDDGNMCIYRGSGPNDNQGTIWCSNTTEKQQGSNPDYVAEKGKYGKNWMSLGSTLAAGDFLGSTNGNLALIMQTDGNLVLYTFKLVSNCSKMSDGKIGGGVGANALYNIGKTGFKSALNNVAYIDQNSELHPYPSTNIQYTDSYSKMDSTNSAGYDIPDAAYSNATVDQCKTTCNSNSECAGFVMSAEGNICWPKTDKMYPNGDRQIDSNSTLYIRGKEPKNPPIGVPETVNNIDSLTYKNYVNGGELQNKYGLANASAVDKERLQKIQDELNDLTKQINTLTNKFITGSQKVETQSQTNFNGFKDYLKGIAVANNKIENNKNIDNILNDSDIVVLQKNYNYLFWSILAAGTLIVSMNIMKK